MYIGWHEDSQLMKWQLQRYDLMKKQRARAEVEAQSNPYALGSRFVLSQEQSTASSRRDWVLIVEPWTMVDH